MEKSTDPTEPLTASMEETTVLIQRLEQVLGEMAELARFDAVLEDLKKTIKAELELLEAKQNANAKKKRSRPLE